MIQKGKGNTVTRVKEVVAPFAEQLGISIWDIRFLKEGTSWYLRIFIDKEGGISVNDCVDLSRLVNKPLDEADLIEQAYILEVSSPGIERELTRQEHFHDSLQKKIMLRTIRPIEGVRDFSGLLSDYADGILTMTLPTGEAFVIPVKETSFVKLDDFNITDFEQPEVNQ